MLLRSQASGQTDPLGGSPSQLPLSALRFSAASELMETGTFLRESKDPAARKRLEELSNAQEAGPGLRVAGDRLNKLKLHEPS